MMARPVTALRSTTPAMPETTAEMPVTTGAETEDIDIEGVGSDPRALSGLQILLKQEWCSKPHREGGRNAR